MQQGDEGKVMVVRVVVHLVVNNTWNRKVLYLHLAHQESLFQLNK